MKINNRNLLLSSDSYKCTHWKQYPEGTTKIYSYLESRGSEKDPITGKPIYDSSVFFGLQYILKEYFIGIKVTTELINEAEKFWNQHFGIKGYFNRSGWEHIRDEYGGKLPITIKAVPEGTVVPLHNVLMTIENNDPKLYWLTNFLETMLMQVWYPITVATNSRECKKTILKYLHETGDPNIANLMLHDFGFRGVSSHETASIGGASHLINFMGSDTVSGIVLAMNYYNANMCGISVAASEHSTATPYGQECELQYLNNMLDSYPTGIISVVADSYNVFNFVGNVAADLKSKIFNRDGKVVFRPDSGDPVEVNRKLLNIMWDKFSGSVNEKGYKVLDSHVGIIQGDGIDLKTIGNILQMAKNEGFAANNFVFGSGGSLLQKFNRDTLKFAIKCSFAQINDKMVDVAKNPVTASFKRSKAGRLKLIKDDNGKFKTISSEDRLLFDTYNDELVTVFKNGELITEYTFDEIKNRADVNIEELNLKSKAVI